MCTIMTSDYPSVSDYRERIKEEVGSLISSNWLAMYTIHTYIHSQPPSIESQNYALHIIISTVQLAILYCSGPRLLCLHGLVKTTHFC